jgi:hypothetical protein
MDWGRLRDAYGSAEYMPAWLAQAESSPSGEGAEDLWGRLCHQGDVYTASYAALPHLLRLQSAAAEPSWSVIALIASIEIARAEGRGPAIPDDLAEAYDAALRALPGALAKALNPQSSELLTRSACRDRRCGRPARHRRGDTRPDAGIGEAFSRRVAF